MKEIALSIGPEALVGILSMPARGIPPKPVVLLPNTGLDHRVGPNRLHVILARMLAEAGHPVLRLDLSGMGDSPAADSGSAVRDLQACMDHLGGLGYAGPFAALGVCSGAHDIHCLAMADDRVKAIASIDGYAYPTAGFYRNYLQERVADPRRLLRYFTRRFEVLAGAETLTPDDIDYFRQPSRAQMRRDLAQLMQREAWLCYIYTGQMQYAYNYPGQLADAFPRLRAYERFELHHLTAADHTFTTASMRATLAACLLGWLQKVEAPPAQGRAAWLEAASAGA